VISIRKEKFTIRRNGSQHPYGSPSGVFKCPGGYIMLLVQQHEFSRIANAIGRPELVDDPRFKSNSRRVRHNDLLKQMIEDWFASFPDRDGVIAALDKYRVPCAPVWSLEEAMASPHLRERKTIRRVRDRTLGEFDIPGFPVKFSHWEPSSDLKASRVGEDNEAVLRDLLELSAPEIESLYTQGVLLQAPPAPTAEVSS
jgi:CoA:oxalate CoA-transferase